ncbi:MAG TPA: hypothetical protein DCM38_05790 [Gammaproteobacteria bacterium]|nr:hypothetical protein [Gammaproteobacteria bacterium]
MTKVVLYDWQPGFNKVALNRLLRNQANYSLASAKQAVDSLLEGKSLEIVVDSAYRPKAFLNDAISLGAVGKIITREQNEQLAEIRTLVAKMLETEAARLSQVKEIELV